jgi:hypothetical protein
VTRSVEATYLAPGFGEGRKLVRHISLQLIYGEIVWNEEIDRMARLSVFNDRDRAAL